MTSAALSRAQLLLPVLFLVALPGCLTIRQGRTQIVPVTSSPTGATVRVEPGGSTFQTPDQMILARSSDHALRFEMPGYQTQTIVLERKTSWGLLGNVVWIHPIGMLIGLVVDLSTGSGYYLDPETVSVELRTTVDPVVEGSPQ